jgi:hypothetical protein
MSNQFDRTVSKYLSFLDNEYVSASLSLLLILYASFIAPKLPEKYIQYFQNPFIQLILFFIIVFVYQKNATLSLLIAIAVLVTLMLVNNQIVLKSVNNNLENFDTEFRNYPNTYYNTINPHTCDKTMMDSNTMVDNYGKDDCATCSRTNDVDVCRRCTTKSISNVRGINEELLDNGIQTYSNVSSMDNCLSNIEDTENIDNVILPKIEVNRNVQSNNLDHLAVEVYPLGEINSSCGVSKNFGSSILVDDGYLYSDHLVERL